MEDVKQDNTSRDDYENRPVGHKVYTYLDDDDFYNLIHRAKLEKCHVDEKGRVDFGNLLRLLCHSYSVGDYIIQKNNNKLSSTKATTKAGEKKKAEQKEIKEEMTHEAVEEETKS